jgi:hypothetical protein
MYSYLPYCCCCCTSTKSCYLTSRWTFFVTINFSWCQIFLLSCLYSIFRLVVFIFKWLLCQKQASKLYYISLFYWKDLDLVFHDKISMHSYRTTQCHIPENNNHHSVVRTSDPTQLRNLFTDAASLSEHNPAA